MNNFGKWQILLISLMAAELAVGKNILDNRATKQRAACAQIDFNAPSKITYWSPYAGHGPVVGYGFDSDESENMLKSALNNLTAVDDHQYRLDKIITAIKCIANNNLYEFHANLIGNDNQNKSCTIQIYKNHQQSSDGTVTAVVISCPDDEQYVKTYSEVKN